MHGAAAPVTLLVSTVASKQLPDVTMVRMHNVPRGINVHGLMDCLLKHFQFGPEYTVVSEYGGVASGEVAAAIPTWYRSDVCIAELRAPVSDAKLARLPSAFTCFGQQVSVSVQPSILAKAYLYQHRAQSHVQQHADSTPASSLSPRTKRRQQQKARAQKAALRQRRRQQQQQQQAFHAASPLAGKRRDSESMSDAESSGTAEAPSADSLAMVPLTPNDSHASNLRRI
ncbi:TPA: hypothetical protein ACH3X1_016554 [Trebouxia sp. C0004]